MADIRSFFGGGKPKSSAPASVGGAAVSKKEDKVDEKENNELKPVDEVIAKDAKAMPSKSIFSPTKKSDITSCTSDEAYMASKYDLDTVPSSISSIITWQKGEKIPFSALVNTFEAVSKVSGRLDKESLFTKFFISVILTTPEDLETVVYLSSNEVAPAYDGLELGIGDSLLVKAICEATGRNKVNVDEDYLKEGDLGVVALSSRASQKTLSFAAKPKPLTAAFVLEQFRTITRTKGDKAQGRKVDIIKSTMIKCQGVEAKYIVRSLQGKLRIGTASQTILVALAHAFSFLSSHHQHNDFFEPSTDHTEKVVENDAMEVTETAPTATVSEQDDLVHIINNLNEKEPPEARKLRQNRNLSKEKRNELAVIAVKRAYSECPNLSILTNALLTRPLHQLYTSCRLVAGVPVSPMLAKPTKSIKDVLKRLEGLAFTMEYKYDGERAQVHLLADGTVKIFSRNSEDNSMKYPDLTNIIWTAKHNAVESCVIDCEVVAFDREKNVLLPFQILSTRKRKVEEGETGEEKVKVVLQAFDMLMVNNKSLLCESLRVRRMILHKAFTEHQGYFYYASGMDHVENGDTTPIEQYLQESCAAACEGLMVKTLDSNASYEPSKRSLNWLKVKKDYIDGMGICDSVDLVVIGAYHGRGKRTGAYGAYLMACYDPERDEYQSVCKVGTGFKDEDLARLSEKLLPLVLGSSQKPGYYNVGEPLTPDVWFQPKLLWEIQAADLTASSVHKGGIGKLSDSSKGIGLRFPRYLRDRDDKKPENATSAEQIAEIYHSQDLGTGGNDNNDDDDDDEDII